MRAGPVAKSAHINAADARVGSGEVVDHLPVGSDTEGWLKTFTDCKSPRTFPTCSSSEAKCRVLRNLTGLKVLLGRRPDDK